MASPTGTTRPGVAPELPIGPPPGETRDNQGVRKLIGTIVVLLALLVAADFGGRALAQSKAQTAIANTASQIADPDVTVHGFPFLTQAIGGSYRQITVASTNVSAGRLAGVRAQLDLFDVTLPLSDALSGTLDQLTAGRGTLTAEIPAASLATVLGRPGLTVGGTGSGPGGGLGNGPGNDTVRIGTTVAVAGTVLAVTIDVAVSVSNGVLHLVASPSSVGGVAVPADIVQKIGNELTVDLPLTGLPFPLQNATVTAKDGSLDLFATATAISAADLHWIKP